jgi:diaminopimelate epimerase
MPPGHPGAADFTKYQALGNDYVIIDPQRTSFTPTAGRVRLACDRHRGLGADGLLYGPLPADDGFRVMIFNPDGTECERSGNGLRIFGRYLREAGYTSLDHFVLYSAAGPSAIDLIDAPDGPVRAELGAATLDSAAVGAAGPRRPMLAETLYAAGRPWTATCVDLGNPHCVITGGGQLSAELVREVGPELRDHELFRQRMNVELLEVVDRETIRIEIFERGAGYTLASGSSGCAAAFAASALGLTGPEVTVRMPGGDIRVSIDPAGRLALTGLVAPVLEGRWAAPLAAALCGGAAPSGGADP